MKNKLFNPEKSLISLGIFKATVLAHIIAAAILSLVIAYNSELSPSFSYEGVNFFVEAFRVPLAILALIIPMVALLASNHRSEQTIKQIKSATSQNTFSNHYKHLEEFEKYCNSLFEGNLSIIKPRHLHSKIYRDSKNGNYSVSHLFLENLDTHINSCLNCFRKMQNTDKNIWAPALANVIKLLENFERSHYLRTPPPEKVTTITYKRSVIAVPEADVRGLVSTFVSQISIISDAVKFDPSLRADAIMQAVLLIDVSKMPPCPVSPASNYNPIIIDNYLPQA